MLSLLVTLVVFIIIGGLIYWAVHKLAAAFGLPPQVLAIIQVALVIILVVVLLQIFFGGGLGDLRIRMP